MAPRKETWEWRFATWSGAARSAVVAIVLGLATWGALVGSTLPAGVTSDDPSRTDAGLYRAIIERMESGSGYYEAVDELQGARGYPTRPFVSVREPTVAVIHDWLPQAVVVGALWALIGVGLVLALRRFEATESSRVAWVATTMAAAAGIGIYADPSVTVVHEVWASVLLFVGLLALPHGKQRWSMFLLLGAALTRELVAPVLLLMAVLAWRRGRRRTAMEWLVAAAVFVAFYAAHARLVLDRVSPSTVESPGWLTFRAWPGAVDAYSISSLLGLTPFWITSAVTVLGLLGWAMRTGPVHEAVAWAVVGFTMFLRCRGTGRHRLLGFSDGAARSRGGSHGSAGALVARAWSTRD